MRQAQIGLDCRPDSLASLENKEGDVKIKQEVIDVAEISPGVRIKQELGVSRIKTEEENYNELNGYNAVAPEPKHFDRKGDESIGNFGRVPGQYPVMQHPAYRAVGGPGPPNSFGFPHFFPNSLTSSSVPTSLHSFLDPAQTQNLSSATDHEKHLSEMNKLQYNSHKSNYLYHQQRQDKLKDLNESLNREYRNYHEHQKLLEMYPPFRAPPELSHFIQQQQQHQQHHNNMRSLYSGKHSRKWNNNLATRLLQPTSVGSWFARPETPINSSSSPALAASSLRNHVDLTKAAEPPINGRSIHGQIPTICTSIRCTLTGCTCDSFTPGKRHLRYCDKCHHGWVLHALARLSSLQPTPLSPSSGAAAAAVRGTDVSGGDVATSPRCHGREDKSAGGRVEVRDGERGGGSGDSGGDGDVGGGGDRGAHGGDTAREVAEKEESPPASETVEPTAVFDVASLVLYGSRALPIRLKILLDQLFNQLPHAKVTRLLAAFGWTHEDYSRGYILQDSQNGPLLDRWSICSAEEEPLVLQQFLRFPETRPLVQQLLLAAGTTSSTDAMSPSRRPSPPTMPLAHLPPSMHLLHCRLPHPGSRLAPSLPPTTSSHLSMSPSAQTKHFTPASTASSSAANTPGNNCITTSPPRSIESSHLASPLNRLQNMQPFDLREFGGLGLAGFPPLGPPPLDQLMQARKSLRPHPQSPHSPPHHSTAQLRPPMPVAPISTTALAFGHPLAVAGSSGALPPNFPVNFSHHAMGKLNTVLTGQASADVFSGGEKSISEVGSETEDDDENSGSALNLSRKDSGRHDKRSRPTVSMQGTPALSRPQGVPGRKSQSPGKRSQWGTTSNLPPNLGTPFINPATGKKRVQCNVCLKTFCDKGALKIHFSAVHLREMHQCTVKGCNTKFSSRRSRNRHSANPNPKLHSPHLRRKISPHDGRSSMAHALVLPQQIGLPVPASGLNHLPFGSFPLLTPPPDLRSPASLCALDFKHLDLSSTQSQVMSYDEAIHQRMITTTAATTIPSTGPFSAFSNTITTSTHNNMRGSSSTASTTGGASPSSQAPSIILEGEEDEDDEEGIVIVGDEMDSMDATMVGRSSRNEDDRESTTQPFNLATKRPKLSIGEAGDEDLVSNADSVDDTDSMGATDHHSVSFNNNGPHFQHQHQQQPQQQQQQQQQQPNAAAAAAFNNRGVRKRKSQHPTRCAMPTEIHSSSTDGDSSNDAVFQDQPEDMSMSRLEAEQQRKASLSPSISNATDNESTQVADIKEVKQERTSETDNNLDDQHQQQDEPRDLSSRASSVRSPKRSHSPEPKREPRSPSASPTAADESESAQSKSRRLSSEPDDPKDEKDLSGTTAESTSSHTTSIAPVQVKEERCEESNAEGSRATTDPEEEDDDDVEDESKDESRLKREGSHDDDGSIHRRFWEPSAPAAPPPAAASSARFNIEAWPHLHQPYQHQQPLYQHHHQQQSAIDDAAGQQQQHGQLLSWLALVQRLALHSGYGYGQ
ncbi:uncharacterized protein LOC130665941 isoform X2 [Microplitis mediator]|uniref:uncharacterized protein LOC130665941 isoform X2 n=1 Tax=Microplitis mediator TaxID=375433 RepID=UPI002557AB09|nr:uncharacterized protein LOC130665941 isoform X2 [Microplitis mediator]